MAKDGESSKGGMLERLTPILLVLSVGLAFMVGVLWQKVSNLEKSGVANQPAAQQQQAAVPTANLDQVKELWDKDIVKFGSKDAKVLFVEAGDPSCPYCHVADGNNPELAKQIGTQFTYDTDGGTYRPPTREMKKLVDEGKASYAYIYMNGHGNGEMAAKALYCAQDQGKFWQVHNVLYTNKGYELLNNTIKNDKTKTKDLVSFIGKAADTAKLTECLDSGKYDARLAEEMKLAQSMGVNGTPGFFVNDKNFAGAYSFTDMQPVVDAALK